MSPLIKSESSHAPRIEALQPNAALPGGEVEVLGSNLGPVSYRRPVPMVGELAAPVVLSRGKRMVVRVPEEAESGKLRILRNGAQSNAVELKVASQVASGVHMVANPAIDRDGNIYATLSGARGQETPVSVYRVERDGEMHPFVSGIMNATGLATDENGNLYVSSRHEGTVYRVTPAGAVSVYAEGMGIATGIAFDGEGNLYVGDRSGTIFKIAPDRQIFVFATLEASVSAYHLAFGMDGTLFVSGPTTSSFDSVYAIDRDGATTVFYRGLGRPQGLAVDIAGSVYVAASLHGRRGVVRITPAGEAQLVVAGQEIVGFTFIPGGNALVATLHPHPSPTSAVYHVALGIEGWRAL
jgi:sugar lactone lactonase YvrE